jgi:hypothetical protein
MKSAYKLAQRTANSSYGEYLIAMGALVVSARRDKTKALGILLARCCTA